MEDKSIWTLKDYLEYYNLLGYSEQDIVRIYIIDKDLEMSYSKMILDLTQSRLEKELYRNAKAKEVIGVYNGYCGYVHNIEWTQEENILWDKWLIEYALNFKLSEETIEKVKEIVPNMVIPNWGYRGLVAYINKKCGVLFKNQEREEDFELLEDLKSNRLTRW